MAGRVARAIAAMALGSVPACASLESETLGSETLNLDCGLTCPHQGLREGNASISTVLRIDRYFRAQLALARAASVAALDLGLAVGKLRELGLDAESGALPERLTNRFALEGPLTLAPPPASCHDASRLELGCDAESDALCAEAVTVYTASELRCDPSALSWHYEATEMTSLDELESFTFVVGERLAVGFAGAERARRLLAALEQAEQALPNVEAAFEATPLPPQGDPHGVRIAVGLGCGLREMRRVPEVLAEQARPLQSALLDWGKLEAALTTDAETP